MSADDFADRGFFGEARCRTVLELEAAFDEVKKGSGSRIVALVSPPGWGKTRIVQELYGRLAAKQSDPPYWPPAIVEDDQDSAEPTIDALNEARKSVYPTRLTVPAGATMDWMWWGVLCDQRKNGLTAGAMFDDAPQLYAHAEALMREPADDDEGRLFDAGAALVGVLGLLNVALPGVGTAITIAGAVKVGWDNLDLRKRIQRWRADRRLRDEDRVLATSSLDHLKAFEEKLVRGLGRLAQDRPMVIVLDDAHFADASLLRVVEGLVRQEFGRVLVVATVWTSHVEANEQAPHFGPWTRSFTGEHAGLCRRIDLDGLTDADVQEVIRRDLPAAERFSSQLSEKYGTNLLLLRAVLRLDAVRRRLARGKLDPKALADLPTDVAEAFQEHWRGLPNDVQRALAASSQPQSSTYLPRLIAEACETHDIVEDAEARLAEAVSPVPLGAHDRRVVAHVQRTGLSLRRPGAEG